MADENSGRGTRMRVVGLTLVLLVSATLGAGVAVAHDGGDDRARAGASSERVRGGVVAQTAGNGSRVCNFGRPSWRQKQTIVGVEILPSRHCRPDNPYVVAAVTKGTNNVPSEVLMRSGLGRNAVQKGEDLDGDGDPDVITINLEVTGLNEFNGTAGGHAIAPGIKPAFWAFAPETRGMVTGNSKAARLVRMPSPPIRVEQGDKVRVVVENTHYFPHTIHFHGVDHPYSVNGSGNDGVPQTSEKPIPPGESRTYEFQPRTPGTMFYHCHVVPSVHIPMGLNGMFIVEKDRSNNRVQTFNIGAGKVRHPSRASELRYAAEYDLHYQSLDKKLHNIPKRYNDVRTLARKMNREYDPTNNQADYFLLNGRSFPYTVLESTVVVEPGRNYRLRILNAGPGTVSLHTHGHKFEITHLDGVQVPRAAQVTRDVISVSPAQRADITLSTVNDGLHSYGAGIWLLHDHREVAVTNDGISPGGTISAIAYESYVGPRGIPQTKTNLSRFFDPAYYEGEVPVWGHLDGDTFGKVAQRTAGPPADQQSPTASSDAGVLGVLPGGDAALLVTLGVLLGVVVVQTALLVGRRGGDGE